MAKVFRIFNNSGDNKPNWFDSVNIGQGVIDSIQVQETDGTKLPTSIPSPFAQIDLVKTAFQKVCEEKRSDNIDLNSSKDVHRLVSNALDIGQLFFKIEKNQQALSIDVWDKNQELTQLKTSSNQDLKHLGETLELFLTSVDAVSYNFNVFDKIFILKFNNKVIGGTSPKTLFFASADALKQEVNIYCNEDKMLDDEPLALYKRDRNYIRFLFQLRYQPDFALYFSEVAEYLDLTLNHIQEEDLQFANLLRQNPPNLNITSLTLPQNSGVVVESLPGFQVKKEIPQDPVNSGFIINTTKVIVKPPLALPVDPYTENIIYTDGYWQSETEVPINDPRPLSQRTLPRVNDRYPYLTLSDFLSNSLVRLQYKMNPENYYCLPGYENYLLPLTERFFDYFSAEDLINMNLISLKEWAGGSIEVTIKIPVQNNQTVPYSKKYLKSEILNQSTERAGKIIDEDFTLGIYPFVKSNETDVNYTIAVAENPSKAIKSFDIVDSISNKKKSAIVENRSNLSGLFSTYHLLNQSFDYLQLNFSNAQNIIIPKFKQHKNTNKQYHFAIDFGTTNTHIEYLTNNINLPESYQLESGHFIFLRDQGQEVRGQYKVSSEVNEQLLNQEVIHNDLGNERYNFPFRSVLFENETINYHKATYLYSHANIGFDYGKVEVKDHLEEITNLKWLHLNENFNNERIEKFIYQLLLLCKNKVLMTNGNIDQTKITWLYPTSMTYNQRNLFKEIWEKQSKKAFSENFNNLNALPESIAPFYYYTGFDGLMNQVKPTASIDIGGGTTDITIFEQNEPKLITSVKFAGDAIFGDGYSNNIKNNGFMKKFYSSIKANLEANKDIASNEIRILEDIYGKSSSVDVSNYLFSLKENYNLNKENINLNYSALLKNDQDIKLIFLLFYSSMIYHLAQLMFHNKTDIPKNILLSGTASKSINLLDSSLLKVNKLFTEIFNHVYGKEDSKLEVKIDNSPKIITAKGALKGKITNNIDDLVMTYPGLHHKYEDTIDLSYNKIDSSIIDGIINNINDFFDTIDEINVKMDFSKSFGISSSSYEVFKEIRNENLQEYLLKGLEERKKDVNDNKSKLEETLFFYPFTGLLNELGSKVADLNKVKA